MANYSGGLLDAKTLNIGSSLTNITSTSTSATDNNESTLISMGGNTYTWYEFPNPVNISAYQVKASYANINFTLGDGSSVIIPNGNSIKNGKITDYLVKDVKKVAIRNAQGSTTHQLYEFNVFEKKDTLKILVRNTSSYLVFLASSWQTITTSEPTEADYLQGNTLDELSQIPESAWQELTGPVELCYYTDNPDITEAQFNIETEPFTLADEFEGESISIIEYTDNPNQTESTVTLETEPFTFYDEMGDSFEVLYYTDDPSKTSAELEINANYTPLDEIEDDFEVVTWTNKEIEEVSEKLVTIPRTDVVEDGAIHSTVVDLTQGTGVKSIK